MRKQFLVTVEVADDDDALDRASQLLLYRLGRTAAETMDDCGADPGSVDIDTALFS